MYIEGGRLFWALVVFVVFEVGDDSIWLFVDLDYN